MALLTELSATAGIGKIRMLGVERGAWSVEREDTVALATLRRSTLWTPGKFRSMELRTIAQDCQDQPH
jgi:hypothetical protein